MPARGKARPATPVWGVPGHAGLSGPEEVRMVALLQWKCPDPGCEPTDWTPVDVDGLNAKIRESTCGGCGKTYPSEQFMPVHG